MDFNDMAEFEGTHGVALPREDFTKLAQEDPNLSDMDDSTMDVDEDGGVALSGTQTEGFLLPPKALNMLNAVAKDYHQASATEIGLGNTTWRLPVMPMKASNKKLMHLGINLPAAKAYEKSCRLIARNWKCDPAECVPSDLRNATPYSLAMLLQLRKLSGRTKNSFGLAQSLLLDAWQLRSAQRALPGDGSVAMFIQTNTSHLMIDRSCEGRIIENIFGSTVDDISEALNLASSARSQRRKASKKALVVPRQIARQQTKFELQVAAGRANRSQVADRVMKRRRAGKVANMATSDLDDQQDEIVDVQIGSAGRRWQNPEGPSAAPPNSPVLLHQRPKTLRNLPGVDALFIGDADVPDLADAHDDGVYKPSKQDQHYDEFMSNKFLKLDVGSQKGPRRKRARKLEGGGFSRHRNPSASMPSERVKLDAMPSLHDLAPVTDAGELARLGQLSLSEQPTLELTLRPR